MEKENDKSDWFDEHIEVVGPTDKWENAFKGILKEMAIEEFNNDSEEEEEESEVE